MNFNGRSFLFVALGCGLTLLPASRVYAQQADDPALKARQASGQDSGAQDEPDPLKRKRSDPAGGRDPARLGARGRPGPGR